MSEGAPIEMPDGVVRVVANVVGKQGFGRVEILYVPEETANDALALLLSKKIG